MKYFIIFMLPLSIYSQHIEGIVYDNNTSVKHLKIANLNKQIQTYTDHNGAFKIRASVNDTLFFNSVFYDNVILKVTENHFNTISVIEVKKKINTLNKVIISSENFNTKTFTQKLNKSLNKDIKNNPHKYKQHSKYGLDFVYLAKKIFASKHKSNSKKAPYLEVKALDSLFKNDSFFTMKLLREDLNIDNPSLFLDYCETKKINTNLLSEDSKLKLLDIFVAYSKEFIKLTSLTPEN